MRRICGTLLIAALAGCNWTPQEKYFSQGEASAEKKEWSKALESYEKLVKTSPGSEQSLVASRKAAHIADIELNDYQKYVFFLRQIILNTKSAGERSATQKELAIAQFEKLADYRQAVTEINRALDLAQVNSDRLELRLLLGRAHFLLNEFFQARSELDLLLKENLDDEFKFNTLLLKANIYLNERKHEEASALFEKLIAEYPERSKKEQVAINLAVCYEEQDNFDKALEVLERLRSESKDADVIDLKIRRLKERKEQAPGAKGLKK